MSDGRPTARNPWAWIPTLYLAEGLPYALALSVTAVLYKNLGRSNADITFYTGWLYLPWVIKPFWSPLVDVLGTRRRWIWIMQLVVGAALGGVALTIPTTHFFQLTLAFFWLLAFNSATHDIAADGFYLLANTERQQALFSGVRNTFYRLANMFAQGALVWLSGKIYGQTHSYASAWSLTFAVVAALMAILGLYHLLVLPKPEADRPGRADAGPNAAAEPLFADFLKTFGTFFQKPGIVTLLLFLLLYRFGEAQLVPMTRLFLMDLRANGGLGLSNEQYGLVYGTIGVTALMCGGILGGIVISRHGLKFWLWIMLLAIHLPDAVFIWLSYAQPASLPLVAAGVAVEQFGYGFGFSAFMLYMIYIARGPHQTAHYAICTGFMAMGMMIPGSWSGWLQQQIGYPHFFVWVVLATIPSFIVTLMLPLDPEFGRRKQG